MTMERWDSKTQALLDAARKLEVGEPPALAEIRQVAKTRQRRSAYVVAFAIAVPLGAAAAAGTWVVREQARAPAVVRPVKSAPRAVTAVLLPQDVPPPSTPKPPAPPAPAPAPMPDEPMKKMGDEKPEEAQPPAPTKKTGVAKTFTLSEVEGSVPGRSSALLLPGKSIAQPSRGTEGSTSSSAPGTLNASAVSAQGGTLVIPAPVAFAAPHEPDRTSLSDEAALLSSTLSALRTQHQPELALRHIAEYRGRFPNGSLKLEMTLAAAEAQRALGHEELATRELESLKVELAATPNARAPELK